MRPCDMHLIELEYEDTFPERVSTYGDSEATGRMLTEKRVWRVMAPSLAVAQSIWQTTRAHVDSWKALEWHDRGVFNLIVWAEGF